MLSVCLRAAAASPSLLRNVAAETGSFSSSIHWGWGGGGRGGGLFVCCLLLCCSSVSLAILLMGFYFWGWGGQWRWFVLVSLDDAGAKRPPQIGLRPLTVAVWASEGADQSSTPPHLPLPPFLPSSRSFSSSSRPPAEKRARRAAHYPALTFLRAESRPPPQRAPSVSVRSQRPPRPCC